MEKGFSLIELLAVIIVMAVIVTISVPIVTNIVNNSKEKTNVASIEMYGRAISQAALTYELEEKKTARSLEQIESYIKYNGEKVECSIAGINGSDVYLSGCSVEGKVVEDYTYNTLQDCALISGEANAIGSKYICKVNEEDTYMFYVLSHESNGTTNLIMERNICEDGSLVNESKSCLTHWYDRPENRYGPVTAMNYLDKATKDWTNIPNIIMNYADEGNMYGTIITVDNVTQITGFDGNITERFTNLKARLPYLKEINGTNPVNHVYLYDYLNNNYGYWLLSSEESSNDFGFVVFSTGNISGPGEIDSIPNPQGVRPVINIKL